MGHAKHWIGTGVWVGMVLACASVTSSCKPGELDEKQEKYLRNQVKKYYPPKVEEDAAVEDTDDNDDSNVNPDDDDDSDTSENTEVNPNTTDDESSSEVTSAEQSDETSATTSAATTSAEVSSSTPDAGGGAAAEIPDCFLQMVSTTCSGSACHYGGAFNFPPNFEDDSLFELLTTTGSSCTSANSSVYIDLESPEDSYLIQKVRGEGCGTPMPPPGEGEISEEELGCVEAWLESL